LLDTDRRVASPKPDRVALELDRHPTHIGDELSLVLEELVPPCRGEDEVAPIEAEGLEAREALLPPQVPRVLRDGDVVTRDDGSIDRGGVSSLADLARDVEEVAVAEVADGELLQEAARGGRDVAVVRSCGQWCLDGTCPRGDFS